MMASPQHAHRGRRSSRRYAIGCHHAFIYVRGEVLHVYRRLLRAVEEALRGRATSARTSSGSGYDLEITVHAGAGAYICGEETALLDSLEGLRGQPRLKPPFPAVAGLYARPTVVNNVESIASVPGDRRRAAPTGSRSMGTERSTGFGLFSLSGHVTRPGPVRGAARHHAARAARDGRRHPRGPRAEVLDARAARRRRSSPPSTSTSRSTTSRSARPGSMLGTRALQIFDETTSVVRAVTRWTEFYKHESCGKCTPCREGTYWLTQVLQRHRGRAGHARATSTCCWTCATTSSAARSARSATAPPARSRRPCSTSGTSSRRARTRRRTCSSRRSAAALFAYTPEARSSRGCTHDDPVLRADDVPGPRRTGRARRARGRDW